MAHYLIAGMTGSGKTCLGKSFCREFRRRRIVTAVLDPMHDDRWQCDFKSADIDKFFAFVRTKKGLMIFIDEAGGFGKYAEGIQWIMTKGRHLGHCVFIVTQDLTQVSPLVREQCELIYLFAASSRAVRLVSESFNKPEILAAAPLGKGEFYTVRRFGPLEKRRIDFVTGRVFASK